MASCTHDDLLMLLRDTSVSALRRRLPELVPDEQRAVLDATLNEWERRALGPLPLRDALLVDQARGLPFYAALCEALGLPPAAELPPELATLLPSPPQAFRDPPFEPPSGWRRVAATALVALGTLWLGVQMLVWWGIPAQPAGVPLALYTLALLVGVRARLPGYLGSACIWLVANLPGFHYAEVISWPALPLLAVGVFLLALDKRIRAMWVWVGRALTTSVPPCRRNR
jgi:hypothetical protein